LFTKKSEEYVKQLNIKKKEKNLKIIKKIKKYVLILNELVTQNIRKK
jgi:hypothetical protein